MTKWILVQEPQQQVSNHRHQHLYLDRILRGTQKGLDLQVLLDPLEKQFNLPALFVKLRDVFCRTLHIVGDQPNRVFFTFDLDRDLT